MVNFHCVYERYIYSRLSDIIGKLLCEDYIWYHFYYDKNGNIVVEDDISANYFGPINGLCPFLRLVFETILEYSPVSPPFDYSRSIDIDPEVAFFCFEDNKWTCKDISCFELKKAVFSKIGNVEDVENLFVGKGCNFFIDLSFDCCCSSLQVLKEIKTILGG